MKDRVVTLKELGAGFQAETGVRHRIVVAAPPLLVRLEGLIFETNKTFLLPPDQAALGTLAKLYAERAPAELLIVGHTDTSGEPRLNDPLSLERAKMVAAFLKDDPEPWLAAYADGSRPGELWGEREDSLMISALPTFVGQAVGSVSVKAFQEHHNVQVSGTERPTLAEDGLIGALTRRQLIMSYMALDGATVPEADVNIAVHGCGENFPLDESGELLDGDSSNSMRDPVDRRVELFFFGRLSGVSPTPTGENSEPGSTEYREWRKKAERVAAIRLGPGETQGPAITVKIHAPAGTRPAADQKYRLRNTSGSYDITLVPSHAATISSDFLAIQFRGVDPEDRFTLEQIQGSFSYELFRDVPYSELEETPSADTPPTAIPGAGAELGFLDYDMDGAFA